MHQSKDRKTYSKFADSLTLERPSLEGILACGIDGEKPLIDGFKREFLLDIYGYQDGETKYASL